MNCEYKEYEARPHLERILRRLPTDWKGYCLRAKQHHKPLAEMMGLIPPKGQAGAPRKVELAQEAALLQGRGMTFPQIAGELNKSLPKDRQTTADAVRKLLTRHSQPDKI